jgi:hypothetical protein
MVAQQTIIEVSKPRNEAEKTLIERARSEEEKYKTQIPDKFYKEIAVVGVEYNDRLSKSKEEITRIVLAKYIPSLYNLLREKEIPAKAARDIITARLLSHWAEKSMREFFPAESKNQHMSQLAKLANENTKAKVEEKREEEYDSWLSKQPPETKEELGRKGGKKTYKKLGSEWMRYIGKKGQQRAREHKVDESLSQLAEVEPLDLLSVALGAQQKEILVEIPRHSEIAKEIIEKWALWNSVKLKISLEGEIKNVYWDEDKPKQTAQVTN